MNRYVPPNPYAPPQAPAMPAGYAPGGNAPARIEGNTLVVANGTMFPPLCLKCGSTREIEWRDQKFLYVPPWARFLGYLLQLVFAKRSRFNLPVCQPCHKRWKTWNRVAALVWIPGAFLTVAGVAALQTDVGDFGLLVLAAGLCLALAGLVGVVVALIMRGRRGVYAVKIDKTHSWLRGVHGTAMQAVTATPWSAA
jgi:hypothetical protein